MGTTEYALSSLSEMDRYVRLMAEAGGAGGVIDAVDAYLESWSEERIRSLQKTDGGWGPFDQDQRAAPLHGLADVVRIADALSRQYAALKEVGIAPSPELLELDLFFFFARQVVEQHTPPTRAPQGNYRHSSDRQAA